MKAYAAYDLHVEVLHFKYAPACFPERGKRVEKQIVQRFAVCQPFLEYSRLAFKLFVRHYGVLGFQILYFFGKLVQLFYCLAAVGIG